jgi:hypothetical protein
LPATSSSTENCKHTTLTRTNPAHDSTYIDEVRVELRQVDRGMGKPGPGIYTLFPYPIARFALVLATRRSLVRREPASARAHAGPVLAALSALATSTTETARPIRAGGTSVATVGMSRDQKRPCGGAGFVASLCSDRIAAVECNVGHGRRPLP